MFTDREFAGIDVRKTTYDLYLKADFVDSLFYRENKDVVKEKFKQAFTIDNFTDRSNFMIDRFKSLCAIKDSKTTNQESTSFMSHLNKVIAYEFLPKKLKNGLQDILKDYEEIIDNVEGFALQDAYNIYAQKNEIKQVTAPISFKQIQDILINSRLEDEEIFQSILNFCNSHSIYQEHSYLNHESSSDEITKLMHKTVDCAEKIKELFAKYKGVFCNDVLEQAIDNYDIQYQSQELSGDINQLLSSENSNI